MGPGDLDRALCGLELPSDPRLIRGFEGNDDAGVFVLADGMALVQTVDVLTPIVDDPYVFGRIAAVNALSDVYAMGGTPLTALNIVCFPVQELGVEVLRRVLEGGVSAIAEAGAVLVGGHSIKASEPKYGLAVTGVVDPAAMMTNDALRPGQHIVVTKPVGTGVLSSATKQGAASSIEAEAMVASMARLNDAAAAAARAVGVRAASDVTGFGLVGHLVEMARASRCRIVVTATEVPLLMGALEHAGAGRFPGGSRKNRDYFSSWVSVEDGIDEALVGLLFDAQTSGGLLLGADPDAARTIVDELCASGHDAAVIGQVIGEAVDGAVAISS